MGKENSRTRNSILNIATGLGGQMIATVLKFVVRTVFIHTLGKSYLGINGLFSDILTMLSLTELGFDTAINFKMYKPLAEGDDKRVRVLLKFYKQAYRVVGATILCLGLALMPFLPVLIKDYDSLETLGINATLIFGLHIMRQVSSYLFFAYRSSIMKTNQKMYILDLVGFGITFLTNITKILVLVFFKNFVLYTATVVLFNILQNLINAVIATKYYPQFFTPEEDKLSKDEVKGLLKDCGAVFIYKLNNVVIKATDNTVISAFIGLVVVGLYSNYLLFYTTVNSFFDRIYTAVKASMGNLFAVESTEKKYAFFQIMNYLSVLLYGTAGVGVAVCADELIERWLGADFVILQPFAILMGTEILFHGIKVNLGQIRNVSGVFRQMWFRPVIGVIINLGVSITLVQFIGVYGVVIGTITADIFANFLVDPRVIYKYSFNGFRPVSEYYLKNLLYLLTLVGLGAANYWICGNFFTGHGWWSVIVHAMIVGITVPTAIILIFHRSHECQYVLKLMKKLRKKLLKKFKKKKGGKSK